MKVALLSMGTCQTAIKTLEYFSEQESPIDFVLVETAQRTRFPKTVQEMNENHAQFEIQLGVRAPKSWKRKIWDSLPLSFRNAVRRHSSKLPGLNRISVEHRAQKMGIPVVVVPQHSSVEGLKALQDHQIDYALLTSSARLIKAPLISDEAPKIINAHFAQLPRHRALDAMAWSILAGAPTGLATHFVDEGIDTGPLLGFWDVAPEKGDTLHSLEQKMDEEKPPAFFEILKRIEKGEVNPVAQKIDEGTHHRPMTVQELLQAESLLQRRIAGEETPNQEEANLSVSQ